MERSEIDRGKLFFDDNNVGLFRFHKGEPHTCSSCKNDLGSYAYVCGDCKKPFCYDCVKDYNACKCHSYDFEFIFNKSSIGEDI